MPVYHITLHAYRSWNTDNPKGHIRKDFKGVQPPHRKLAQARDSWANFSSIEFSRDGQRFLILAARDATVRRRWDLLGTTVTTTHVHAVIAVRGSIDPFDIQAGLKSGLGFQLAKHHATKGRPYFSHGGVPERVKNAAHLRYLFEEYFPKHESPMWCKPILWSSYSRRGSVDG